MIHHVIFISLDLDRSTHDTKAGLNYADREKTVKTQDEIDRQESGVLLFVGNDELAVYNISDNYDINTINNYINNNSNKNGNTGNDKDNNNSDINVIIITIIIMFINTTTTTTTKTATTTTTTIITTAVIVITVAITIMSVV